MKKLILVVAMMFVLEGVVFSDFTGEFNVKGGLGAYGNVSLKEKIKINGDNDQEKKESTCVGISGDLLGEFLLPVNDSIKAGIGSGYLYPRKIGKKDSKELTFSYLPIYGTIQINPISSAKGVFFKGNIGYTFFFNSIGNGKPSVTIDDYPDGKQLDENNDKIKNLKNSGGLYCGIGAGYEFSNGLTLDAMYSYCAPSCSYDDSDSSHKWDCGTHLVSINLGYKLMKLWDILNS
ncbi:hypothetical protein AGMMS50222_09770 [Endomicrobiia bacterium]|nr:hypothetical protein AGMMS49556_07840 [Endomicrobiia bacterium]GHT76754.1 hypothetical protein AGMMS50222_09770 [Endomicrobiia bacterium]